LLSAVFDVFELASTRASEISFGQQKRTLSDLALKVLGFVASTQASGDPVPGVGGLDTARSVG
jgi:hypothetical protein